jgi:hypothetical protein
MPAGRPGRASQAPAQRRPAGPGKQLARAAVCRCPAPAGAKAQRPAEARGPHRRAPARPHGLECGHHRFSRPGTGSGDYGVNEFVDGQFAVPQRVCYCGHDLVRLAGRQELSQRRVGRKGTEGAGPLGQVGGGQQVHGAPGPEGPDQGSVLPERFAEVGPGNSGAANPHGQLCGLHYLGVRAAHGLHDVGRRTGLRRSRKPLALQASGTDLRPGKLAYRPVSHRPPPLDRSRSAQAGCWQDGHQYSLRAACSARATGVPQTRQGWPWRR